MEVEQEQQEQEPRKQRVAEIMLLAALAYASKRKEDDRFTVIPSGSKERGYCIEVKIPSDSGDFFETGTEQFEARYGTEAFTQEQTDNKDYRKHLRILLDELGNPNKPICQDLRPEEEKKRGKHGLHFKFVNLPSDNNVDECIQALHEWFNPSSSGSRSPTLIIPNNIPRSGLLNKQFVGRDDKMKQIDRVFDITGSQLAIVAGGGFGKTEIAIQYLNRFKHKFPGGICWVYARATNSTSSHEVSKERVHVRYEIVDFAKNILEIECGPPHSSIEEKVKTVFCNWKKGRILLIFDDLESYEDYEIIEPIIPRDDRFNILITSRLQIGQQLSSDELRIFKSDDFTTLRSIDINLLTKDDSVILLERFISEERIQREREAAEKLVESLEYLPLALELVARYLSLDPHKEIAEVLYELMSSRETDSINSFLALQRSKNAEQMTAKRGVAQALDLSWNSLPEETKSVAEAIVLFREVSSFSWNQVKKRINYGERTKNLSDQTIEKARQDLLFNSLIKPEPNGKYRMHSLTTDFLLCKSTLLQ